MSIDKSQVFEWFYDQGDVFVTVLIKGMNDVQVPDPFYEKEMETFQLGESPTPDLSYDHEGIFAPMRFGNLRFDCFFPWASVAILTGKCAVIQFAADEKEKKRSTVVPAKKNVPISKDKDKDKKPSHLKLVK